MARMIPKEYIHSSGSHAERLLFPVFENALSDEFLVLHSQQVLFPDHSDRLRDGEADFLLLHRQLGLLLVEAKTGFVRCKDGSWYQNEHPLEKDPFKQAATTKFGFITKINQYMATLGKGRAWFRTRGVPHGFAIALPNVRQTRSREFALESQKSFTDPAVQSEIAIKYQSVGSAGDLAITMLHEDANSQESFEGWIRGAYRYFNKPMPQPLTRDEFNLVKTALLGDWTLETAPDPVSVEKERFGSLKQRVEDFLYAIDEPRRLIQGVAGSGKTVAALSYAHELNKKAERVLFLTFNQNLAEWIASQLSGCKYVDVFSFHTFCKAVITAAGRASEWIEPDDPGELREFYSTQALMLCYECLDSLQREGTPYTTYDQIIIDEGQDFENDWWTLIEDPLLLKHGKNGRLCIFYDPDQNFRQFFFQGKQSYRDRLSLPPDMFRMKWDKNYRNTKAIARYIYEAVNVESRPNDDAPAGEPPLEDEVDPCDQRHALAAHLKHYQEQGFLSSQILVVGRRPLKDTSLSTLKNPQLVEASRPRNNTQVRYLVGGQVKGLEADCIIVIDYQHPSRLKGSPKTYWYLAASRAQHRLSVIHSTRSCICIHKLPPDVTEDLLRDELGRFGVIDEINLVKDRDSPDLASSYVTFQRSRDAEKAAIVTYGMTMGSNKNIKPHVLGYHQKLPRPHCVGVPLGNSNPTLGTIFDQYREYGTLLKINRKDKKAYLTFHHVSDAERAGKEVPGAFQLSK